MAHRAPAARAGAGVYTFSTVERHWWDDGELHSDLVLDLAPLLCLTPPSSPTYPPSSPSPLPQNALHRHNMYRRRRPAAIRPL